MSVRVPAFTVEAADTIAQRVVMATVKASKLSLEEIIGHSRHRLIVRWRQAAMNVAQTKGCSYLSIGRMMCRDHATVITAVRRQREMIDEGDVETERRETAIYQELSTIDASAMLRREPRYARRTLSEPMMPDPDSNERFAIAMVGAHPEMVLHIMRAGHR